MKAKKYFFLSLLSLIGLSSCSAIPFEEDDKTPTTDVGGDDNKDDDKTPDDGKDDDPSKEEINYKEELLNLTRSLKENTNYTIDVEDIDAPLSLYFNEDVYSVSFDEGVALDAYIEDEIGIYPASLDYDGDFVVDYYMQDENYDVLKDIYANLAYSLQDLELNEEDYSFKDNQMILKDLWGNDGQALFSILGFIPESDQSGLSLYDVDSIYFEMDEDKNLSYKIEWNEDSSGRGTTIAKISNIGSTIQPEVITDYIESGGKGITRVSQDDPLFTEYLPKLKNLRNFTLEVKATYPNATYDEYTLTSLYTENAYWSHTTQKGYEDLGYIEQDGVVKKMALDSLNGEVIVGDTLMDIEGNAVTDLYGEAIYSFNNLTWNYDFKARPAENDVYHIDDSDFIYETGNLTNAYIFSGEIDYMTFEYNEEVNEFYFEFYLTKDRQISMKVSNIGTTVIGEANI